MGCEDLTELCVGQGISAPTLLGWWLCPRGGGVLGPLQMEVGVTVT